MPVYEYSCEKCEKTFEITQKISDPPLTQCPTCTSPVRKLISRTSFQLKGSGWYATDYKKPGSSAAPKSDSPAPATEKTDTGDKKGGNSGGCGSGGCGSGHKH